MNWIKIDRDENGFATEECLEKMFKAIPFVIVSLFEETRVYAAIGDERDFDVYKDGLYTDALNVNYYLPIPKLEV